MTTRQPRPDAEPTTEPPARTRIQWNGPRGHVSVVFGELLPGSWYEAEADLAAYLIATHPEAWAAKPAPAPTEE